MIRNNSQQYPLTQSEHRLDQSQFQLFPAKVLTVDYERKVCTLEDLRNGMTYVEVTWLPANASSLEATDVQMPEEGSTCLAAHVQYGAGFTKVAVVNWLFTEANRAQEAIATRALPDGIEGWNERKRGVYRKAYPGQKTVTTTRGYTEKIDEGWDRSAADLSREKVDAVRRTWSQTTSRRVSYTDAGLDLVGPVNRPDAEGIEPRTLPDGSKEYVVYLDPEAKLTERYKDGKQDVLPIVERLQRTQEFALDYPLPLEILESELLDSVLGTTRDQWERTETQEVGGVSADDQSFLVDQKWDHPAPKQADDQAVGPTTQEGPTPRRRGFIVERSEGTLVGYNRFDRGTYGKALKPVLFPYSKQGRFGADVESGHIPVEPSDDHVETRLAASAMMVRFPYEYNTTRWDVTKEGMVSFEIGSTIPKENIPWSGDYEHPHGAGRSLEGHLVGSMKMVIGKNRDEEDAIDIQALGQTVLRLGADDGSLPDDGRQVWTQERSKGDTLQKRSLQYWKAPKLKPGDAGDLENKTGAENVSLRAAMDGGTIIRFGARNPKSKRRHLVNGYADGPGKQAGSGIGARTSGRPTYGAGDSVYAFHDLTKAGSPVTGMPYYPYSGAPITNMDNSGLSVDFHAVRDVLLRMGANEESGQSLLMDLAGGIAAWVGRDKKGRSCTATLDGGAQIVIGAKNQSNSEPGLSLEVNGDLNIVVKGNYHLNVTGDIIEECVSKHAIAKTDSVTKCQKKYDMALVACHTEAPDIRNNQGAYESDDENT